MRIMVSQNTYLILTGGTLPRIFLENFLKENDVSKIICVDGALKAAHEAGISFDYLVGDFDTADDFLVAQYKEEIASGKRNTIFKEYNPVKDATDTDIAVSLALEEGAKEIILLGATGSRIDHMLANIHLLLKPLSCGVEAYILDEHNKIYLIDKGLELKKSELYGPYVSFLPFGGDVKAVTLTGFKYNVARRDYLRGDSLGVSNELLEEKGQITLEEGVLAVFETRD